jgi:hypothetical protein
MPSALPKMTRILRRCSTWRGTTPHSQGGAMHIQTTSGSAGAAPGVIGTGLALALPDEKWIGWVIVVIGALVFMFDVHIDGWSLKFQRPMPWLPLSRPGAVSQGVLPVRSKTTGLPPSPSPPSSPSPPPSPLPPPPPPAGRSGP